MKSNFERRAVLMAVLSLAINLAFVGYNLFLGINFRNAFAIGISIYYLLLTLIIVGALMAEMIIARRSDEEKLKTRITNYKVSSIIVFVMDFCLIAPIILMVTEPRDVKFGLIPAIAMAVFCVYKIVVAIVNYTRSKKSQNPTTILLKELNIIGAIVSVLTLQHTLIMVNGGMVESMRTLSLFTSVGFILLIIGFSIVSFIKNKRLFAQRS